jgi:hypothetical protein
MNISDSKMQSRNTLLGLIAIMVISILMRTVPALHLWPNFTPIAALALFSGAVLRNRKWMFVLPIGAMLISDTIKEISVPGTGFYPDMAYVYGSFFAILAIGMGIKNTRNIALLIGASIVGSILFFLVTNFGVWMSGAQFHMYSRNATGLMECYVAGIPFFKNTLISDLLFNTVFFGGYYLITSRKLAISR